MINPAYTGVNNVFSASAISRGQWIGLEGAPFTNTLNISTSLVNNRVGVGLLLIKDQFGVNNNTELHMMYSYKLEISQSTTMSFGIQVGQMSYRQDFSTLNQNQDLLDPDIANQDDFKKTNFGTGIFLSGDNYYFGVSIPRMLDIDVVNNNGDICELSAAQLQQLRQRTTSNPSQHQHHVQQQSTSNIVQQSTTETDASIDPASIGRPDSDTVTIGGMDYTVDGDGNVQEQPNETLQAGSASSNPVSITHTINNSQVHHADSQHDVIDNPVYAPAELGWQQASDYAFLIGERSHLRRRTSNSTRVPHGRPPDAST